MALSLKKSIEISAPIEKVWDALVNPEKIKKYLFGTNTVSSWKVGEPILFEGEWEGKHYQDKGKILKLEERKKFEYTYWSSFSGKPDSPENYLIVSFELKEKDGKTLLTLKNSGFATKESMEHSKKNWDLVINKLKEVAEEQV